MDRFDPTLPPRAGRPRDTSVVGPLRQRGLVVPDDYFARLRQIADEFNTSTGGAVMLLLDGRVTPQKKED